MNEAARKKALSLLDKRDYSRKMLIDKLTDKGVTAEDAAEVVDRLCAVGVVDDGDGGGGRTARPVGDEG